MTTFLPSIYQTFKNENFQAIGLDVWNGSAAQVQTFKIQTGITYPLSLNASASAVDYGVIRDYSVVIDQDGIIQYKGPSVNFPVIVNKIEELLTETAVENNQNKLSRFALHQNYPNPFNPSTTISFVLPKEAYAELSIYNPESKLIKNLLTSNFFIKNIC